MNNKYKVLGLMYASKNLTIGQDSVISAIRSKKAKFVLISNSCSERTLKTITDKCKFYEVQYAVVNEHGQIAKAIGKDIVKVVSTNSNGFANKMKQLSEGE